VLDKLKDEPGRLAALDRYRIMDSQAEEPFDKITRLVQAVLDIPMAAVTLIGKDRQWLKSRQGIGVCETARDVSFCTHTIQTHEPMVVPDATIHPLFADNPLVTGAPFIRSYLGVPLHTRDGYNLGALCGLDTRARHFDVAQIQIMKSFAALVMDEMELRLIAQSDFLTHALTRRALVVELERAWARFARQGEPAAVLVFDIDRFKSINDTWGHATGDGVLCAVASCCSGQVRSGFREAITGLEMTALPGVAVSASFGVAALTSDDQSVDAWLARADVAMYQAKQSGRNRCCVAGAE
jgi:GGDEF domain-containing protein